MKRMMMMAAAVFLCALVFTGCDSNTGNDNQPGNNPWDTATVKDVNASNFVSTFNDFTAGGYYKVNLTGNINDFGGVTLNKPGVNVALKGAPGGVTINCTRVNQGPLFRVEQGTLAIEGITILVSADETLDGAIIRVEGNGNLEIRNGTVLSNLYEGVAVNIGGGNVTMLGGEIKGGKRTGLNFDDNGVNGSFTMKGGAIKDNGDNGIGVNGSNKQVTIEGDAVISGNNNQGIMLNPNSDSCSLTIRGNAVIEKNTKCGVIMRGTNNTVTIDGSVVIRSNTDWGLVLQGANSSFTKKGNSVIYGTTPVVPANKNGIGAIRVETISNPPLLQLFTDAAAGVNYAAKLDSNGDSIEPGSKQGPSW
jgi:hypothetical protein